MSKMTPVDKHKKSKLEEFSISFEYNRSFADERRATKLRTDTTLK